LREHEKTEVVDMMVVHAENGKADTMQTDNNDFNDSYSGFE